MKRRVPGWRAYWLLMCAAWRGQAQYRTNLVLAFGGVLAFQGFGLVFVWSVISRFGALGGWTIEEIAFLYAMRLTAHALWIMPGIQLDSLDETIRTGEFDRYLIRPAGALLQLLSRRFNIASLGELVAGVVILLVSARSLKMDTSAISILFLSLALVGGAMVEGSVQLAVASLSFKVLSTQSLRTLLDDLMNIFGGYPLKLFPDPVQLVLTFVVPLAFVAYLPATVLLQRTGDLRISPWVAYGAPLAGPLLLALSYLFWRSQLHRYGSTGN